MPSPDRRVCLALDPAAELDDATQPGLLYRVTIQVSDLGWVDIVLSVP